MKTSGKLREKIWEGLIEWFRAQSEPDVALSSLGLSVVLLLIFESWVLWILLVVTIFMGRAIQLRCDQDIELIEKEYQAIKQNPPIGETVNETEEEFVVRKVEDL
tara:strand:+ start:568 stop:882 length:315 start_codon:yes stop_codon:yes gene_type:complete